MKANTNSFILPDQSINLAAWLQHIAKDYSDSAMQLIRHACALSQLTGEGCAIPTGVSCLQHGIATAELLHELSVDEYCLSAAIIASNIEFADLDAEDIREQLGEEVSKLVTGIGKMSELDLWQHHHTEQRHNYRHIENLRKMLVTMVEDVRVVLIKLAERTCFLKSTYVLPEADQKRIAKEMLDVYAPLANRLGIYQIKWQLEDSAFAILEKQTYQDISHFLESHLAERELVLSSAINQLTKELNDNGVLDYKVTGRSKHIYSIYKKMSRKHVGVDQIYDVLAIRILTQNLEDCYAALSIVHTLWEQIPQEFDDYIATPKQNGYQSIHTAVIGPQDKNLEVQIRTFEMHKISEFGIAAHWHYKQGGKKPTREGRIAWLRQVLDWQRELSKGPGDKPQENLLLDDRVYVLTPTGEIIDLTLGATPLDFAYQIHSEVGHRCRGAKVNGSIVPLNYHLKTGEQVEILTARHPQPSRDWINPHLGYLNSPRSRAKVLHWFKLQDHSKNLTEGLSILNQEIHRLGLEKVDYKPILEKFHLKSLDDLAASIGCGDLRLTQVIGLIQNQQAPPAPPIQTIIKPASPQRKRPTGDVFIAGVGNLLTHPARCCQPIPGEAIIGYITRGQGVSIHRRDCVNILQAKQNKHERLIEVQWGHEQRNAYPVDIFISAYDRRNLVRDVTAILSNENINVLALNTITDKNENSAKITLTIEIDDLVSLSKVLERILKLQNVIEVRRENGNKQ